MSKSEALGAAALHPPPPPGSPSPSLIAASSPDQAPSPLGLPLNCRTSFVPLKDTLCSQSNVSSLGAGDTALPVFWSRAPGCPPCDHFTHLPSHKETSVCVRERCMSVCVFSVSPAGQQLLRDRDRTPPIPSSPPPTKCSGSQSTCVKRFPSTVSGVSWGNLVLTKRRGC